VETAHALMTRTFRAGRSYELVAFERLPESEQAAVCELRADPDFYGVLIPRPGTGRTIKALGKDTALLWYALQTPGVLPAFALTDDPGATRKRVASWLLDGVLEVEEGGRFVSGADAVTLLEGPRAEPDGIMGKLQLLAHAALRYGESLRLDNAQELALRLYGFGRQPLTPSWSKALSTREAVMAFVAGEKGSAKRRELETEWLEPSPGKTRGWLLWSHAHRSRSATGGVYKLYVSPEIHDVPEAFRTVLEVASLGVRSFKIGADAAGLLRPDKLVLYFNEQEALFNTANRLSHLLKEVKAQGVPFSAAITNDGLLSWGMDPPDSERLLAWQEPESWRLWLVRRLAAAMIAAQSEGNETLSPGDFARARLRHQGVDVDGWTPSMSIWRKN
jgi:hypothetical protein